MTVGYPSRVIVSVSFLPLPRALVGCGIPAQYFLKDKEKGLRVGYGMISRGEIGLVIASIGKNYGIVTDEVYVALIVVIFITTIIPPILLGNSFVNDPSCVLPDYIRDRARKGKGES